MVSPFLLSSVPGDVAVWAGTGVGALFAALMGLITKLVTNLNAIAASRNRESELLIEKALIMEKNKELETDGERKSAQISYLLTEADKLRTERDEARRANESRPRNA